MIEEVVTPEGVEAFWSDCQDGEGETFTLPAGDANYTDVIPSATGSSGGADALPTGHVVTLDLDYYLAGAPVDCLAPPHSPCHAVYDCECDQWGESGDEDGRPWHDAITDYAEEPERHFGAYDSEQCGVRDWIGGDADCLVGEVSFLVRADWSSESPVFRAVPDALPALVSALSKVTAERDRARDLAAALEAQLAQVAEVVHGMETLRYVGMTSARVVSDVEAAAQKQRAVRAHAADLRAALTGDGA